MSDHTLRPLIRLQSDIIKEKDSLIARMVQDIAVLRGQSTDEVRVYYGEK